MSRLEQITLVTVFAAYAVGGIGLHGIEHYRVERAKWASAIEWLSAKPGELPLVVDGAGSFLKLSWYGPPNVRSRMVMLPDTVRARRYGVDDSADHTLELLNPWFHLPLAGYDAFTRSRAEFVLLSDHWHGWAEWQWLTRALADDGWSVTVTDQHGPWLLYHVTRPRAQ